MFSIINLHLPKDWKVSHTIETKDGCDRDGNIIGSFDQEDFEITPSENSIFSSISMTRFGYGPPVGAIVAIQAAANDFFLVISDTAINAGKVQHFL